MPDIRYLCLSDLHFGAQTSLLTNLKTASSELDCTQPSPVLVQLVECLKDLISQNHNKTIKPTLILNGDILEFALVEDNEAAMVFERFIDLILPEGNELFERIIYIPGNHDHHLWETARETQYVDYLSTIGWGQNIPAPWHATNIFNSPKPLASYFLTRMVRRIPRLKDWTIETAYPNFGVRSEVEPKCVIFHHGHLVESMYTIMSTLKTMLFPGREMPTDVWDLEKENFAWIDFFWSTLGRSSGVVGYIYEKLQDMKQVKKLLANLSNGLAKKYDLPGWGDRVEAKFLDWAFEAVANKIGSLERNNPDTVLSKDSEEGLRTYMQGPLRKQLLGECENTVPANVTFVFGHTHKPFQEGKTFDGYSEWVNVYNTGGWVVDTIDRQPLHGGAVVLIDENLDATSLHMYNEADKVGDYVVRVQEARHPGDLPSPFHDRIEGLVDYSPDLWKNFSEIVAQAVNDLAQDLHTRVDGPG